MIAIASCEHLPEPDVDAAPLMAALAARGLDAQVMPWTTGDFAKARLVVLRSTWDYVRQRDRFVGWAEALGNRLVNPPFIVRWNTHKRYLRELSDAHLPVVETVLVPQGTHAPLEKILARKQWFKAVVKPAVGAGSFGVRVVTSSDAAWFSKALAERDLLVQPFMQSVEEQGERSVIVIEGEVTHGMRKTFRLAGDAENTTPVALADDERDLAQRTMAWVTRALPCGGLLYGRVDMVRDGEGAPRIMELELTEPSLFFASSPRALALFVAGIERRYGMLKAR